LKPGEWLWAGDSKALGPMAVVVSLTEQRLRVPQRHPRRRCHDQQRPQRGYETPTGVFTILQKDKDHHSNVYDNAPMPYQQRLTWKRRGPARRRRPRLSRIAWLRAPAHRICRKALCRFQHGHDRGGVRSRRLAGATGASRPAQPDRPGHRRCRRPAAGGWPAVALGARRSPKPGPVSIVLSRSDRIVFVYRDGREIGRSRLQIKDDGAIQAGTRAWIVAAGYVPPADAARRRACSNARLGAHRLAGRCGFRWRCGLAAIGIGSGQRAGAFRLQVMPLLVPGTVLVSTDEHVLPQTTGVPVQVIDSSRRTRRAEWMRSFCVRVFVRCCRQVSRDHSGFILIPVSA
jgi:hypothetical protein